MQIDNRIRDLAKNILVNSLELKKGEKIYIEAFSESTKDFLNELIHASIELGAIPFYFYNDNSFVKNLINGANDVQIEGYTSMHKYLMEQADCYLGVRGHDDLFALSDVDTTLYNKIFMEQVHMRIRVPKTRWCVMRYPNNTMAALSRMSLKSFEDFYFNSCLLDYKKMGKSMLKLKKVQEKEFRCSKVQLLLKNMAVSTKHSQ